jgi:anion-transporting  ArsA/GET3 family ATPase
MVLEALLERRLVLLSGKGGVGKSVVGAALALAASERGRRVLLVEVETPLPATRYLEVKDPGPGENELLPGLFAANLAAQEVMDEYIRRHVRVPAIVDRIVTSPVYRRFYAAAPGLKELMLLGRIVVASEERVGLRRLPRYDLVVADLPATGHGLAMLKVPLAASAAIPVGPVGRQARAILAALRDRDRTALVIVAVPEEMAVIEALELQQGAAREVGIAAQALILNACHEPRFTRDEDAQLARLRREGARGRLPGGVARADALAAAARQVRRVRLSAFHERRLRRGAAAPVVTLPFLYAERLGRGELRALSARLEQA